MLLARMLLVALLVLHPFAGVSGAARAPIEPAGDPCGAVCCCGAPGSCGCVAEAPSEPPSPSREPASPAPRAEIAPPAEHATPAFALHDATEPERRVAWVPASLTSRGALESLRLLCVWRT